MHIYLYGKAIDILFVRIIWGHSQILQFHYNFCLGGEFVIILNLLKIVFWFVGMQETLFVATYSYLEKSVGDSFCGKGLFIW